MKSAMRCATSRRSASATACAWPPRSCPRTVSHSLKRTSMRPSASLARLPTTSASAPRPRHSVNTGRDASVSAAPPASTPRNWPLRSRSARTMVETCWVRPVLAAELRDRDRELGGAHAADIDFELSQRGNGRAVLPARRGRNGETTCLSYLSCSLRHQRHHEPLGFLSAPCNDGSVAMKAAYFGGRNTGIA